ncbi:GNAT family N-acetyltransferase [Pseudoteredinibacter isoporae]|uniref:RimJ/RimL family protein N-acetyltransferase n=1 Tax=Pseudoteredinibacter isoporae TaxID=570281 RepID=A0A7X0MXN1_9GAMM|nr:GNAT family N-acetyltransferase [Pseudoteredinibacter isoporae]MBB6523653.1 RimJ/RimL family protein N-acetyltransferase [Pseudoteredinibacter isoporae]
MSFEQAYDLWCALPLKTFVFVEDGRVFASDYIKANDMGPSGHICNCSYMVSEAARGRGLARRLYEPSQRIAVQLGFDIVGTLPKAYEHGRLGYVDCHVMYKRLADY